MDGGNLIPLDALRAGLVQHTRIDEVASIRDKAAALVAYARQRDDVQMERAVAEIKLRACLRIGELSRDLEKAQGKARDASTGRLLPADGKKADALAAAGISTSAAQRYEKLAEHAPEVERYIANKAKVGEPVTITQALAVVDKTAHVRANSGENEWYTPPEYIEAARLAMGAIDCDPASSAIANRRVKAEVFYTAEDDGLVQAWSGAVWMNPPYAQPLIAHFSEAVAAKFESREIEQACVLVNNATETGWFQRMLAASSAVCFPRSRIRFLDPQGNPGAPLQGQAVIYMGKRGAEFAAAFAQFGAVLAHKALP